MMKTLPITFGLIDLPTKRLARFDNVTRTIYRPIYRNEQDELGDCDDFYVSAKLSDVVRVIEAEFSEIDRSFGRMNIPDGRSTAGLTIQSDLSSFKPVAFLRRGARLCGAGDYVIGNVKIKLVVNINHDSTAYDLADIPDRSRLSRFFRRL